MLKPEMASVRVAYIQPVPSGPYGGSEVIMLQLMAALNRDKYQPYAAVATSGEFERALRRQNVTVEAFPLMQASAPVQRGAIHYSPFLVRNVLVVPQLVKWIRQNSIQLLHTVTRGGHIAGLLAARLANIPAIMHVHCLFQRPGFYTSLARLGAYAIVVPSRMAREWLLRSPWSQTIVDKIQVVLNPVDLSRFNPAVSGEVVRASLGLVGCYPVVTIVGALTEWKGQADMVRALPELILHFPQARLLLVGAEDHRSQWGHHLQRLVKELHLTEQVLFLGYREDVPQILAASDIAVLASWRDTYPGAVSEAMASARPVVATRSGGSVDMVVEGETGLLVEPRSSEELSRAILQLARNPGMMRKMGTQGRARIISLGAPEVFVTKLETLYAEALHAHRRQSES